MERKGPLPVLAAAFLACFFIGCGSGTSSPPGTTEIPDEMPAPSNSEAKTRDFSQDPVSAESPIAPH